MGNLLTFQDLEFFAFPRWLTACRYAELVAGTVVGCMPTAPKFGKHVKASWDASWSRLLSLKAEAPSSGDITSHRGPWTDPSDSCIHLKEGAVLLREIPLNQLDDV